MSSVEDDHHRVYNDDDLEDDDDDENDVVDDDDVVDVDDDDDDSTSSFNLVPADPIHPPSISVAGEVTIAVAGGVPASDSSVHSDPSKRQRIDELAVVAATPTTNTTTVVEEKKPSAAFDESRKLFQRLWTDEDEIELLQGFLEYTNSSNHPDTTVFYDLIKSKLQLDFNKNQLVEKLRRLKKKYRTVMSKMESGKDFVFKSSHDQATFEISRKIWINGGPVFRGGSGGGASSVGFVAQHEDGGFDDDDSHLNPNLNFIDHSPNFNHNLNPNHNGIDFRTPRPRKRSRGVTAGAVKAEEKHGFMQQYYQPPSGCFTSVILASPAPAPVPNPAPMAAPTTPIAAPPSTAAATPTLTPTAALAAASIPSLIEETVRSCITPIFKELLNNVTNMNGSRGLGIGMALSPIPLGFGGGAMSGEMMADEKWRKQQMLELEVYSRRLELVQDQIKAQLEELRSMRS